MVNSLSILKQYWHHDQFRPMQEEIIQSVLDGKDTLALLPTGGGKSICFQVPALLTDGLCLVISPLIALMRDQVEGLLQKDIPAVALHSGLSFYEVKQILQQATHGDFKFM
jgi:ATP-dependent DNA helicase RecQ